MLPSDRLRIVEAHEKRLSWLALQTCVRILIYEGRLLGFL
jgi:hypothetical protein